MAVIAQPIDGGRVVIVSLDRDRLRRRLLEPLVAKHFGDGLASEYVVTIVRRDEPSAVVFSSSGPPIDGRRPTSRPACSTCAWTS